MSGSQQHIAAMPLAMAPQGCASAFAQMQILPTPPTPTFHADNDFWGPPAVLPRRKAGETCPYAKGFDRWLDIVTLCWWTNRGRSKLHQRRVDIPGKRGGIDVYEAVRVFQSDIRAAGYLPEDVWGPESPKSEIAQFRVLVQAQQQAVWQQQQQVEHVQAQGMESQNPEFMPRINWDPGMQDPSNMIQEGVQYQPPYQQQQFGTAAQQSEVSQPQFPVLQQPTDSQLEDAPPAYQSQHGEFQLTDFLPDPKSRFDPALLSPGLSSAGEQCAPTTSSMTSSPRTDWVMKDPWMGSIDMR